MPDTELKKGLLHAFRADCRLVARFILTPFVWALGKLHDLLAKV